MGFYENLETWQGLPVVDWTAPCGTLQPSSAYRLRIDWDDKTTWVDRFAEFLEQPGTSTITALVVGNWGTDDHGNLSIIVELIAGARERLPALTALFLGDITSEECEVSWIPLADVSPLFHAYPKLEHFAVRGGMNDNQDLTLGVLKHAHLKSLSVQTGGLNASIVEEVSIAELPELEFLELYLGTDNYGGTVTPADLHTILTQGHEKWPKLRTLGLCDYDRADALAIALTAEGGVPVLAHLQTLNLSLGTLGDEGIEALAVCPAIAKLAKLDIHHHYASAESVAKLKALGIEVDASDAQTEDSYGRFVAVSE